MPEMGYRKPGIEIESNYLSRLFLLSSENGWWYFHFSPGETLTGFVIDLLNDYAFRIFTFDRLRIGYVLA
jgi:hypothetical protein